MDKEEQAAKKYAASLGICKEAAPLTWNIVCRSFLDGARWERNRTESSCNCAKLAKAVECLKEHRIIWHDPHNGCAAECTNVCKFLSLKEVSEK